MVCYPGGDLFCSCKQLALALTLALIPMALLTSLLIVYYALICRITGRARSVAEPFLPSIWFLKCFKQDQAL